MSEIKNLQEWCNEAWSILGKGILKSKSANEKGTNKIAGLLEKMSSIPVLATQYEKGMEDFRLLTLDAQVAADPDLTPGKDKVRVMAVKAVNTKVQALENQLRENLKGISGLDKFIEARTAYEKALKDPTNRINVLLQRKNADATELVKTLQQAESEAALGVRTNSTKGLERAKLLLEGLKKPIAEAEKKANTLDEVDNGQWATKPGFENKLNERKAQLERLQGMLGVDFSARIYARVIKEAQRLAQEGDYVAANLKLGELENEKSEEVLAKVSQGQTKKVQENPILKDGFVSLKRLQVIAHADLFQEEAALFRQAQVDTLNAADVGATAKAEKLSTEAVSDLATKLLVCEMMRKDLLKATTSLQHSMLELPKVTPELEMIEFQQAHESFTANLDNKRLDVAFSLAADLLGKLERELAARRKAKQDWATLVGTVTKLDNELESLGSSQCLPVVERADGLRSFTSKRTLDILAQTLDFQRAVSYVTEAKKGLAEITKLQQDYLALATERELFTEALNKAQTAAEDALGKLADEVPEAPPLFVDRIGTLGERWETIINTATTAAMLDTKALEAEWKTLTDEIVEAATGPGQMKLSGQIAQAKAKPDFELRWVSFTKALEALRALDITNWTRLQGLGKTTQTNASADWVVGLRELRQLQTDVATATQLAQGNLTTIRQRINQEAVKAENAIKQAEVKTASKKTFKAAFAALREELADLKLFVSSDNVDALLLAEADLQELARRATRYGTAPTTPPDPEEGPMPTLDEAKMELKTVTKIFETQFETLKANVPKAALALKGELVGFTESYGAMDPRDAMAKLTEFRASIAEAGVDANTVIGLRQQFEKLKVSVAQSLANFLRRNQAPEYGKALTARMTEAEKLNEKPDQAFSALQKLQLLGSDLTTLAGDPSLAAQKEGALLEQQKADLALKTEYENLKKLFPKKKAAAGSAIDSKGGDSGLMTELVRIEKLVKSTEKSGDYAKALEQLRLAGERADQIVVDPHGGALGKRNNLPVNVKTYEGRLDLFRQTLLEFPGVVKGFVPSLPPTVEKQLGTRVQGFIDRLGINTFESHARLLSTKELPDQTRRAYREAALAKVRSVQTLMEKDPRIISLLANPIAPAAISKTYRAVMSSLTTLDANISRCCR